MDTAARKESLRYLFGKVVDPLGFKFTPDEELADMLLEAEVKTRARHRRALLPVSETHQACAPRT